MTVYKHYTFSAHPEKHRHICEILDSLKDGRERSEFIRRAIEFFSGYLANKEENNAEIANQAFLRIIQLEKELQELKREREEQDKKIAELERTISVLKQAYEQRLKEEKTKEEVQKKEGEPDDDKEIVGYFVYNGRRIPIQAYRAKAYVEFITKHYDLFKVRPEAMIKRFMSEHGWHNDGVLAFVVKKYFPELEVYLPKIRDFEVVLNA